MSKRHRIHEEVDSPALLHVLSPQTLLLATDSSALHLYDLRESHFTKRRPQQTHHPHEDYISSLTPLPPSETSTSGFSKQWITTGGTTLAVTDLRRGVLVQSEDQEEELLSSLYVSGLSARGTSKGEKVLVGGGSGVVTLWERGVWDDQDERIIVDKSPGGGESVDIMTLLPEGIGPWGKIVAVGLGNGAIDFVRLGENRPIDGIEHHDHEGVVGLGFDVCDRLISGGGDLVKVWHESEFVAEDRQDGEEANKDNDEAASIDEDSEEEEKTKKRRKKRKRGKGDRSEESLIALIKGLD